MVQKNKIQNIDVLEGLKELPDNSIDCIVTSPPYWNLRDYGVKDQIGLEDNPQEYIHKIVEIMNECKRVLKPTGTIWLNLGDSYYKNKGKNCKSNWLQPKQRLLIPFRIAMKCQEDSGLILRNDITWVKQLWNCKTKKSFGNAMPVAVKDRLNTTSESLFFFAKDQKYFFNSDLIRIPYCTDGLTNSRGKVPGDCIMFPLEPSKEKHFAMFPKSLPEFCIKAGCPEQVCKKCGTPRLIIKESNSPFSFNFRVRDVRHGRLKNLDRKASFKETKNYDESRYVSKTQKKLVLGCSCKSGFKPGIVLDPFMGSGTTAIVAKKLGMDFIGFELNKNYIKIANRRISQVNNGN